MCTLLPHTSHKLQTEEFTVFGSYKTYFYTCLNDWMLSNSDVAGMIAKSVSKAFTEHKNEKKFNVTGNPALNIMCLTKMKSCPHMSLTVLSVR